jgi:hypothetical protein
VPRKRPCCGSWRSARWRPSEKFSLVNVKDLTWYGHAKAILREWADQFVKIANKQPGEIVKDSAPFDLKPW